MLDDRYEIARAQFFAAIKILATSQDDIQTRLIGAYKAILLVTIEDFGTDVEMKFKFARILDALAVDAGDMEEVGIETAAHMKDAEASRIAALICDFFYDLG